MPISSAAFSKKNPSLSPLSTKSAANDKPNVKRRTTTSSRPVRRQPGSKNKVASAPDKIQEAPGSTIDQRVLNRRSVTQTYAGIQPRTAPVQPKSTTPTIPVGKMIMKILKPTKPSIAPKKDVPSKSNKPKPIKTGAGQRKVTFKSEDNTTNFCSKQQLVSRARDSSFPS